MDWTLIEQGFGTLALGMGFVFIILTILVGFMKMLGMNIFSEALTADTQGAGSDAIVAEAAPVETRTVAAIALALEEFLREGEGRPLESNPGPSSAWKESGRQSRLAQREKWFWRPR